MIINNTCKSRKVLPFDIKTPLLIPSFSSKGFNREIGEGQPQVKVLHNYLKEHLLDASLVSSYDLHHDFILHEDIYISDIVFIDSGGYERSEDIELAEIYDQKYIPSEWNFKMYSSTIEKIQPLTDIALISYDPEERLSFIEQISKASSFFRNYPGFSSDFLCKPTPDSPKYIDADKLAQSARLLSQFNILGFTEKELGNSVLERCRSIVKIRKSLDENTIHIPIHVFGCLDPLNILAYFFCGADIFDGLSWLRFNFKNGMACYINSSAIASGNWMLEDSRLKATLYAKNLEELTKLMSSMRHFTVTHDWNCIDIPSEHKHQLKQLITRAGLVLPREA